MIFFGTENNNFCNILFIRMACAFCYYGLVLMTTELFETSSILCSDIPLPAQSLDTCAADCKQLQTTDYMDLLWTTLAEFPGTLYEYRVTIKKLIEVGL